MQHSPESSVKAPLNTSCVTASVRVTAVGGKPVPRRRPVPYPTGPCRSPGPVRSLCTLNRSTIASHDPCRGDRPRSPAGPGGGPSRTQRPSVIPLSYQQAVCRRPGPGPRLPAFRYQLARAYAPGPESVLPLTGPSAELSRARRQPPSPVLPSDVPVQ